MGFTQTEHTAVQRCTSNPLYRSDLTTPKFSIQFIIDRCNAVLADESPGTPRNSGSPAQRSSPQDACRGSSPAPSRDVPPLRPQPPRLGTCQEWGPSVCVGFGIEPSILFISEKLESGDAALGNPPVWGQRGRRDKTVRSLLPLPLYGRANSTQVPRLVGRCWQDPAPRPPMLPTLRGLQKDPGTAALPSMGTRFTLQTMGDPLYSIGLRRSKAAPDSPRCLLQITQVPVSRQTHLPPALSDQIITQQTQAVQWGNPAGLALTRSWALARYDKCLCILNKRRFVWRAVKFRLRSCSCSNDSPPGAGGQQAPGQPPGNGRR